jgi:hypothetical protein
MSDFVLSANEVGEVITYVAPGFLAQVGYRARYPSSESSAGYQLCRRWRTSSTIC